MARGDQGQAGASKGSSATPGWYASSTPPASVQADFDKYYEETGRRAYKPATSGSTGCRFL